jgi:2-oxoglutarate dehydrogenase E1 component
LAGVTGARRLGDTSGDASGHTIEVAPVRAAAVDVAVPAVVEEAGIERVIIRGPAVKIVENMEASLTVPTATSIRQIQIKLLDENRRWINRHLESGGRGKTSFTTFYRLGDVEGDREVSSAE